MVRDRLKEFHRKGNITGGVDNVGFEITALEAAEVQGQDVVIEMGWIDSDIGKFLKQVESLRARVADIKSDADQVRYLQGSLLDSLNRDEEKEVELDRLMASVKMDTRDLMKKLKEFEEANSSMLEDSSEVTLARIQKVQYRALVKSFSDLLDYYQQIQLDYQEKCKSRVKTMLVIRNGNVESEDQLDPEEFLENGGKHFGNISVFTDGYQEKTEEARQELALADARLNDLLKIETALKELNELFLEMSRLVSLQGEQIDNIEKNVTEAKDFVVAADEQLVNAKKLQKKARKKCIIIIIVLIILAIILGLIIYFSIP